VKLAYLDKILSTLALNELKVIFGKKKKLACISNGYKKEFWMNIYL
jgi:hypothetical protein